MSTPSETEDGSAARPEGEEVPEQLREFGHFRLLRLLGRGAQGVVYLAEDTRLTRKVALKMLEGSGSTQRVVRERFQREASVASRLDHPGICGVHEIGEVNGLLYISMQYVRGTTLGEMIARAQGERGEPGAGDSKKSPDSATSLTGKDALHDVLRLIERAARALHVAHEAGLVHRDVKPGNLMVTGEGHPVLLDFGLARDVEDGDDALTETGQVLGTPAYMSPEQLRGQRDRIDRRTDVYGLGVTLFECLTLARPFSAETFEGLFQQILQATPPSPRRINPGIPRDLATVVEVAMEGDPARRYATALELAEDLRRVRTFEPIRARAASPLTRARKWARRNPGASVAIAATVLFVIAVAGWWIRGTLDRREQARTQLVLAAAALAEADFDGAFVAVNRARDLGGDALRALELETAIEGARAESAREARRSEDLTTAARAREESARRQGEYEALLAEIGGLEQELIGARSELFAAFAPSAARAEFAVRETFLAQRRLAAEELLQRAREGLDLAVRLEAPWGGVPETDAALAALYFTLWREAVREGDGTRESVLRSMVAQHDRDGRYAGRLVGRGELSLSVVPPGAELFLFRYEPYGQVRADAVVPRLVPVPTSGIGRAREGAWVEGFHPGDPCLVITQVEPDGAAQASGLAPGDLVLALAGQPVAGTLFLADTPTSAQVLGEAGLSAPARVATFNGVTVRGVLDWLLALKAGDGKTDELTLDGLAQPLTLARGLALLHSAEEWIEGGPHEVALEIDCLRMGEPVRLTVPAGAAAGLGCEPSAYPLILSGENRVAAGAALEVDPGSYLVLARQATYELQRFGVVVERQGSARAHLELADAGSTPEGFVYVPPGPFLRGGDPAALEFAPAEVVDLPGFFVARRELSNREWFEFLDDPATRARMLASPEPIYVPREMPGPGPMPQENLGGPDTPVMGISWDDARDFLAWRNRRAERDGEPWVFDLPSELEWEKAARGVDGRRFPWGDRFDHDLVVGLFHSEIQLYDAPGGLEPRDESPFGVLDMAGHRREWQRDPFPLRDPKATPIYRQRGASWRTSREEDFRTASRFYSQAATASATCGLRLVARARD